MGMRALWQRLIGRVRDDEARVQGERADSGRVLSHAASVNREPSRQRAPTQADLDAVFAHAHLAKVLRAYFRAEDAEPALLEIGDARELASLATVLQVTGEPDGHCMCIGELYFELFGAGSERLAQLSIHHGVGLRCHPWPEDTRLVDGRAALAWLASRGVRDPLEQFDHEQNQRAAAMAAWNRWHEATPVPLQQYLAFYGNALGAAMFVPSAGLAAAEGTMAPLPEGMTDEYFTALAEMFELTMPDPVARARSLLGWLGRGSARWSGFPIHELVAIALLHRITTLDLLNSVDSGMGEEAVLDGAARFFASFEFQALRAPELAQMPEALRRRLATRVGNGQDADRVARVRAAFGEA